MPRKRPRSAWSLVAVTACAAALALTACGSSVKPTTGSRGRVDDPRTARANRVQCLTDHHLAVQKVGLTTLLIGAQPGGAKVVFDATPGAAQGDQIAGQRAQQGAEVIGSALMFPNAASDKEAAVIESCLALGVLG